MTTVIIDYGSGNLRSAEKSFQRMGQNILVTSDPEQVRRADRVVLPGVGAFADCAKGVEGMREALNEAVITRAVPFLGICVGMQLMAETGQEHGTNTPGFGWLPGDVVPIEAPGLKIPHMGWNSLNIFEPHPVLTGIETGAHAYFVHSYHMATPAEYVLADVDHGGPVTAVVARDNMIGTQFHPEKSQETGLRLIGNFLGWGA